MKHRAQSTPYIRCIYILYFLIFFIVCSLFLLYKKLAKLPILRMGSSVFFSVYYYLNLNYYLNFLDTTDSHNIQDLKYLYVYVTKS